MARPSTSSSAVGNGHVTGPTNTGTHVPLRASTDNDSNYDWARYAFKNQSLPNDSTLMPDGVRSLSYIVLQAFFLGLTFAACLFLTTIWSSAGFALWRLPAFFACLSLFHFLEFWTTAHFNTAGARADSFLLYSNGTAYNVAHGLATLEIIASNFSPTYQALGVNQYTLATGISLVIVGQVARSVAMAQAGTNFNHTPQRVRKQGHELVTTGIYSWLRHPSYFGFFWWALGTQLLVGNKGCLLGYLLALWIFFSRRIKGEFGYHLYRC